MASEGVRVLQRNTAEAIIARIDRLPESRWQVKIRALLGTATFFDSYDAASIAFVLPALIGMWHLSPGQIGLLISSGFAGQLLGALFFSGWAERNGRMSTLSFTVVFYSLFGLGCAFATGFGSLCALRFLQGLGLGGETPVAAAYISEIAQSRRRGRFLLLYQVISPVGFLVASLSSIWVVPVLGWQAMFVIGAAPALLVFVLRRVVPESPRWLAQHGREEEAGRTLDAIEAILVRETGRPLPEPAAFVRAPLQAKTSWLELFQGVYAVRTVAIWIMWFCGGLIGYGLLTWMPTLFRTQYHLSVQDALIYSSVSNIATVIAALASALVIDRLGRRPVFFVSFAGGAVAMFAVWVLGAGTSPVVVMILTAIGAASISMVQLGLWIFTPENYPTRMRSIGCGAGTACARLAAIVAPTLVAVLVAGMGSSTLFLVFAAVGLAGAICVLTLGIETRARLLEEMSP